MKHFKSYFLILILSLSIASCSKSDNSDGDEGDYSELILGSWRFLESTTNGEIDSIEDPCELQLTLTFSDNLSFVRNERSGNQCEVSMQFTGSYTVSGSDLTVNTAQGIFNVEITTLNSSILKVRSTDGDDVYIETFNRP